MKTTLSMIAIAVAFVVAAFYFKSWQCGELFPESSLMACLLWR
jgi:hypothetical protein